MRRRVRVDDRGETLIEIMISVAVMSIAVVALVSGLGTAVLMSDVHRKQAAAGAYVRSFAETVANAVAQSPSAYVDCAASSAYGSLFSISGAAYTPEVTSVRYWNGSSFVTTCTTDLGVQQVSLRVRSDDGRAAESLDLIIRKPCRSTTDYPLDAPCG